MSDRLKLLTAIAISKLIIYITKAVLFSKKNKLLRNLDCQTVFVYTEMWRSQIPF
ncbi:MAG: hypothetical protein RM022_014340 [Nostoc sp. EfeVER01]|uniref:hypothetical protein n=1 Tax=unclassified Nostoc TaxID=2593658 RepID=UPI002AD3D9A5|nr:MULTISPECIES: hypothetical protein [unclassified Nostoc]MDZ7945391.1 hypothetical protein [Nostoc sp. EfeVER01]MDZ7993398.1 hypothetical protein [Nostoc sp. EspVER01]